MANGILQQQKIYYNNADKEKQILSFKNHLEAAAELNIPVIVHSETLKRKHLIYLMNSSLKT